MAQDKEPFLSRWARRKRRAAAEGAAPPAPRPADAADTPAARLPAVEDLTFESDFKDFMHRKVEESVRRVALRKLFRNPHFNVRDGLDVYAEDYTKLEKLPAEMAERLAYVRNALGRTEPEPAEAAGDAQARPPAPQPAPQDEASQAGGQTNAPGDPASVEPKS